MTKPTLKRLLLAALVIVSLAVLTCILIVVSRATFFNTQPPIPPIEFGHVAVPIANNTNFVSVTLTNQSDFVVHYLTKPLQVRSNGLWSGPPGTTGQRLMTLQPRQSGVVVLDAAATNENTRVPVLWGYGYTSQPTKWGQLREDFTGRLNGRGGRGLLFTNYLTDLKR